MGRGSRGEIPIGPIRDAFIKQYNRDKISLAQVAVALGRQQNETSYVQVTLGLRPYKIKKFEGGKGTGTSQSSEGQRGWRYLEKIEYQKAVRLARILDIDPVDLGL